MPMSVMPWRRSAPLSITSIELRNAPAGWSRSPAITSARRTSASPLRRARNFVEVAGAREVAHGEMRHRLEAGLAQADGRHDRLFRGPRRHRAHIDARAGGSDVGQLGDVGRRRVRRLEREATGEIATAETESARSRGLGHGSGGHAIFRRGELGALPSPLWGGVGWG